MTRQNKIFLLNILTVAAGFATLFSLFAMNGFSLRTVGALACAYFFAQLTVAFFKTESILREKQHKADMRKFRVVKGRSVGNSAA